MQTVALLDLDLATHLLPVLFEGSNLDGHGLVADDALVDLGALSESITLLRLLTHGQRIDGPDTN